MDVPPWTQRWISNGGGARGEAAWQRLEGRSAEDLDGWIRRRRRGSFCLLSYLIPDAVDLSGAELEEVCYRLYRHMAGQLAELPAAHPIRLWNHIPHILEPLGGLEHRYMVFNAGRLRAMRQWLGESGLERRVATASGVGHFGRDLVIHCLSSAASGTPVENPRQVPAYRYSTRYGPEPPCFARATRFEREGRAPWLLVGGTASVRGEDSLHRGDLEAQLEETLINLEAVVRVGRMGETRHYEPSGGAEDGAGLDGFRQLRVYHVRPRDRGRIRRYLEERLPAHAELELWHADLCRPELLVEIEGLAVLESPPGLESRAESLEPIAGR